MRTRLQESRCILGTLVSQRLPTDPPAPPGCGALSQSATGVWRPANHCAIDTADWGTAGSVS